MPRYSASRPARDALSTMPVRLIAFSFVLRRTRITESFVAHSRREKPQGFSSAPVVASVTTNFSW
jgi:hypothetical protein